MGKMSGEKRKRHKHKKRSIPRAFIDNDMVAVVPAYDWIKQRVYLPSPNDGKIRYINFQYTDHICELEYGDEILSCDISEIDPDTLWH